MTAQTAPAPFSLGIASFDPLTDGVLIWTRLDGGGACGWEVATDPDMHIVVASGSVAADPGSGVVVVDVTGLAPGTSHWYRFEAGGAASPVGRTRTLPSLGAEHVRVGVTCCARYSQSPFTVYGALAAAEVDVVVHLGDYIYEDTKGDHDGRAAEPDHDCVTLDDYRTRHAQARRDPDLQALHARHPMVVVWDDHDLADNAWRGGAQTHDEQSQGPWSERQSAALRAHQEFLPKRLADPEDDASAWRRLDAGDLLSILCTETRAHRDEPAGAEGTLDADDPRRTMLGGEQARWLEQAAADSSARWMLVASGTVVSQLEIAAPESLDGVLPEKYEVVDGRAINTDQWDGYQRDRRRLTDALAARGGGALVVSGDIHSSWAIEGPAGEGGLPVAVELVCPPAATTPIGQLLPPGVGARLGPAVVDQLDHVRWVDFDHHGFLTLDLTHERVDATWWWVEPGSTTPPEVGRRWVVPHGSPGRLLDPEPEAHDDDGPGAGGSPLAAHRRSRRWRAVRRAVAGVTVLGLARRWRRRA